MARRPEAGVGHQPARRWLLSLALQLGVALPTSHPLNAGPTADASPPERAAGFSATVVSVGDGDSLRVLRDGKPLTIRLACIDAPELAQAPWGLRSRDYLALRLPHGRDVRVIPHAIDRYGRTVAEVISDLSINLAMVEDGQAFAYRRYLASCGAKDYLEAEERASRHRFGVWQVPGGITRPWTFRHGRGREGLQAKPSPTSPNGRGEAPMASGAA
jgi:endonuclease YncB( thermonuclease family)